ncbi:VCBS repeat-containing protein [Streptomyces sp. NBC_00433]
MPYTRLRRTAIATAVALAAGLASVQTAGATGSAPPQIISVGYTQVDEYGPAGDLDVTLSAPTTTDAYIRLDVSGATDTSALTFTDDSGAVLPVTQVPGLSGWFLTIGMADSDGNGIPGAPLSAGTIHLHVAAGFPAPWTVRVTGYVFDGANGSIIGRSGGGDGMIKIGMPLLGTTWYVPDTGGSPDYDGEVNIPTGGLVVDAGINTQMSMRTPPPATHTRWTIPGDQISAAGYTPAQLAAALHVDYSPNTGVYTTKHWMTTADGSLILDFPTSHWRPEPTQPVDSLRVAVDWGLPAGTVTGVFETLADDGTPYARSHETLHFTADVVPAAHRTALYGRDRSGVLWQHQATTAASRPGTFDPRTRVGGGWGVYNTITALGPLKATNHGDLVARDSSGVLWYHSGTGYKYIPFDVRTRIGGGWNIYNQIVGTADVTGDGHPDLVARDAAGVLWLYRGTGRAAAPFATRTRICAGWQGYNQLIAAGDITGDGHPDLLARDTAGVLWYYPGTGNPAAPYANRIRIGGGWQGYTSIVGIGDMTGKNHQDLVTRDAAGKFWYYRGTGNPVAPYANRALSGGGMNTYNTLL